MGPLGSERWMLSYPCWVDFYYLFLSWQEEKKKKRKTFAGKNKMHSLPGAKCFVTGSYLGGKLPVQYLEGEGRGQSSLWSERCELSVWRAVPGSEPHQQAPQAAGLWRLGRSAIHTGLVSCWDDSPGQLLTGPGHSVSTWWPRMLGTSTVPVSF